MKIYLAPMEGPTGYVYRNAYNKYFGGIDTYFTPFVTGLKLGKSQKRDVCKEHNENINIVPQILTNDITDFLSVANILHDEYGYETVNINLGCPSGTVVSKKRGAGFLSVPDTLEAFLDEVFEKSPVPVSIKTRIGMNDASEWDRLLSIYEKYPMTELIIHPRTREDYYRRDIHYDAFEKAYKESSKVLCYNGDIKTVKDYNRIIEQFPDVNAVMIGRGILGNPFLTEDIINNNMESTDIFSGERGKKFKAFLHELEVNYLNSTPGGERNMLFKMKELWAYIGLNLDENDKALKQLRKAKHADEYHAALNNIFR